MKRAPFFTYISLILVAAGACASSEDEAPALPPVPDSGPPLASDASNEAPADPLPDAPVCSPAGWCLTPLPDTELTLKDIWPLPGHAFAVAESSALGIKVLEWRGSDTTWTYIDDDTQNDESSRYAGKIWSPNENELYFTVSPRTIYHGKRNTTWSWTHQQLEDRIPAYPSNPAYPDHYRGRPRQHFYSAPFTSLGVYGTSVDDVYAWYGNTIYRRTSGAGENATWVVEYTAGDLDRTDEQLFFLGGAGTSRDDMWFVGGRAGPPMDPQYYLDPSAPEPLGTCAIVVHKTSAGYRRVADGVIQPWSCIPRDGTVLLGETTGWLVDVQADSANRVVGLKAAGTREVLRISAEGDGYTTTLSSIPYESTVLPMGGMDSLFSLFSTPNNAVWLGGFNVVLRGDDVFDGGTYKVSTIALNGAPLPLPVYQLRGSSDADLWAVGARYALHKTTP